MIIDPDQIVPTGLAVIPDRTLFFNNPETILFQQSNEFAKFHIFSIIYTIILFLQKLDICTLTFKAKRSAEHLPEYLLAIVICRWHE